MTAGGPTAKSMIVQQVLMQVPRAKGKADRHDILAITCDCKHKDSRFAQFAHKMKCKRRDWQACKVNNSQSHFTFKI